MTDHWCVTHGGMTEHDSTMYGWVCVEPLEDGTACGQLFGPIDQPRLDIEQLSEISQFTVASHLDDPDPADPPPPDDPLDDHNGEGMECPDCGEIHTKWTQKGDPSPSSGGVVRDLVCGKCGHIETLEAAE